jgi:TonB family protein
MKIKYIIFFVILFLSQRVFAQKDTLVYYVTAAGDLAQNPQAAYCRLVVYPVGADAKLSAIKGIGEGGKILFSGFSSKHGYPVRQEGILTDYNSAGEKISEKTFKDGYQTGDEKYYYANGNIKSAERHVGTFGEEKKEYYEDGALKYEREATDNSNFTENFYFHPGGQVMISLTQSDSGGTVSKSLYKNGETRVFETTALKHNKNEITAYFPNGNLYYKKEKDLNNPTAIRYLECRDSTGNILVQNGNGYWVEYNEDFSYKTQQGKVVNGLADSAWTRLFDPNIGQHVVYKKGKIVSHELFGTNDTPINFGDHAPQFRGGTNALGEFLVKNITYPAAARENRIAGRVILTLTIEKDGTVSGVKIDKGVGNGCDEEAARVIKMSPPWIPGIKDGVAAKMDYSIAIGFSVRMDGAEFAVNLLDYY